MGPDLLLTLVSAGAAAAIAALVTSSLIPLVRQVAGAMRAVDYPGGRKSHRGAVPRLGGVALVIGAAIGVGSMTIVRWGDWGGRVATTDVVVLLLGSAIVFVIGLAEDLLGVSAVKRLLAEILAAGVVVSAGWTFKVFALPFVGNVSLGVWGHVIAVVWIVGVTNAINLIDGLDGLAGGVVAIISASIMAYAVIQANLFTVILMAGLAGACLGFLRHNWAPATVFMGDAGSLTLGFILASMSLHSSLKSPAAVAILVPLLALGVPVIDTLVVMIVRFAARRSEGTVGRVLAMFRADRIHLHHLLEDAGGRRARAVKLIYGLVFLFCLAALSVAVTKRADLGLMLVVVEIGVVVVVRQLGLKHRLEGVRRRRGMLAQDEDGNASSLQEPGSGRARVT